MRQPISRRLRFEILNRDGFRCVYCGAYGRDPGVRLEVDHVEPVAGGGDNDPRNLVTACNRCNGGKSDKPLRRPEHHHSEVEDALRAWWRVYGEIPESARDVFSRYLVRSTLAALLADIADVAKTRNTPEIDLRRIEVRADPTDVEDDGSGAGIDFYQVLGIGIE